MKAAKAPVNATCVEMYKFCRMLAEKTGRKVRVPTTAEWEYAARSGTSNPDFIEKYAAQQSSSTRPLAVKSKPPNAWGLYDMLSTGWERVSDGTRILDRQDTVDPQHIPPEDCGKADPSHRHGHFGRGCCTRPAKSSISEAMPVAKRRTSVLCDSEWWWKGHEHWALLPGRAPGWACGSVPLAPPVPCVGGVSKRPLPANRKSRADPIPGLRYAPLLPEARWNVRPLPSTGKASSTWRSTCPSRRDR